MASELASGVSCGVWHLKWRLTYSLDANPQLRCQIPKRTQINYTSSAGTQKPDSDSDADHIWDGRLQTQVETPDAISDGRLQHSLGLKAHKKLFTKHAFQGKDAADLKLKPSELRGALKKYFSIDEQKNWMQKMIQETP